MLNKTLCSSTFLKSRVHPTSLFVIQIAKTFGKKHFNLACGGVDAHANFLRKGDQQLALGCIDHQNRRPGHLSTG